MYAGTTEDLAGYLDPYLHAGLQHVVLRVSDAPEQGLEAVAAAVQTFAVPQDEPAPL